MKLLLLSGVFIFFSSRWILDQGKKNDSSKEKAPFSYVLLLAEITTIFVIIVQLLCSVAEWDLPAIMRWVGLTLFMGGILLSVYSRIILKLRSSYSTARTFSKPYCLIQYGPYKYIRHPIYSGTLLMGLGFELAVASYLFFIVLVLGTGIVYICAKEEEKRLVNWFPEYRDYQRQTKKFIPFIF